MPPTTKNKAHLNKVVKIYVITASILLVKGHAADHETDDAIQQGNGSVHNNHNQDLNFIGAGHATDYETEKATRQGSGNVCSKHHQYFELIVGATCRPRSTAHEFDKGLDMCTTNTTNIKFHCRGMPPSTEHRTKLDKAVVMQVTTTTNSVISPHGAMHRPRYT